MKVRAVVVAVVGVGVVGVALAESPAGVGRSAAGCQPRPRYGQTVGKVLKVKGGAFQGGSQLQKGAALRSNATLCAGRGRAGGTLEFEVRNVKRTQCKMRRGARLRLYPQEGKKGAVIQFEAGTTYCGTKGKNKGKVRYRVKRKGPGLTLNDPLFGVVVGPRTSVVKVKLGFVTVSGRGGSSVPVGPGQQTTVPPSGVPQKAAPIQETAEDKKAFGELKAVVPKPDFSRPDADGSATLKRIFASDAIRMGLVLRDSESITFTDRFFTFLARSWNVDPTFDYDEQDTLVQLLKQSKLELLGTADRGSLAAFDVMPLFADPRGETFYVAVERDKVFAEALRDFIRAAVNGGQYSAFYREAFDKEPPLGVLQPILLGG